MTRCLTFWQKMRRYPPCVIRMLARHPRGRLLGDHVIASRSGLPLDVVMLLGSSFRWQVSAEAMESYLNACRIDFENRRQMQRIGAYLRKNPRWLHLRNDPGWKQRWQPLINQLPSYYETISHHP